MAKTLAALLLLALAGCLPLPQVQLPLELPPVVYRSSPLTVQTEYLSFPGVPEPHTPEHYNRSYALRYFHPEDVRPDTVLVLVPGIFGGATSFDPLARQLVASNAGLEVWAWDRRANALEDRSGMVRALEARDPMIAHRYYLTDAGTEAGFRPLPSEGLRFMAYWGLELHLGDLRAVVAEARARAARVILGGHSLGAAMAGFYAAYWGEADAPGDGAPGHADLDGLLLIDGVLGRTGGYDLASGRLPGLHPAFRPLLGLLPDAAGLEAGRASPYLEQVLSPSAQARREVAALLARFAPEALSPGGFLPYPASNAAVLGILEDDRYALAPVFGSSVGEAQGARFGGNLSAFALGGAAGARSQSVIGPAEGEAMVRWSGEGARSDLAALARAWSTRESNRNEWYFPLRLALDIGARDIRLGQAGFVPSAEVLLPTLAVGAQGGLVDSLDDFSAYFNARPGSSAASYILPGLTHLDVLQAEDNPLVPLFRAWLSGVEARP